MRNQLILGLELMVVRNDCFEVCGSGNTFLLAIGKGVINNFRNIAADYL